MMIQSAFLIITYLFMFTSVPNTTSSLQIEVTNLRNNSGHVSMELLNKNNVSIKGKTQAIKGNKCIIVFNDIKDGQYAIRYFHDENSNKELDMNFIGIPTEGIGFSNDAYGTFGPEDFEEWLFDVKGSTKIKLKTTYYF